MFIIVKFACNVMLISLCMYPYNNIIVAPETTNSGVVSAPASTGVAGLRHVVAPETKPAPATPQLPPGQNICADCERLIV